MDSKKQEPEWESAWGSKPFLSVVRVVVSSLPHPLPGSGDYQNRITAFTRGRKPEMKHTVFAE